MAYSGWHVFLYHPISWQLPWQTLATRLKRAFLLSSRAAAQGRYPACCAPAVTASRWAPGPPRSTQRHWTTMASPPPSTQVQHVCVRSCVCGCDGSVWASDACVLQYGTSSQLAPGTLNFSLWHTSPSNLPQPSLRHLLFRHLQLQQGPASLQSRVYGGRQTCTAASSRLWISSVGRCRCAAAAAARA